jgi:hypothetical protein
VSEIFSRKLIGSVRFFIYFVSDRLRNRNALYRLLLYGTFPALVILVQGFNFIRIYFTGKSFRLTFNSFTFVENVTGFTRNDRHGIFSENKIKQIATQKGKNRKYNVCADKCCKFSDGINKYCGNNPAASVTGVAFGCVDIASFDISTVICKGQIST